MSLSDEATAIQKRIGSTPFPDDIQGIADDAHVIIARQAFRIAQLETPEKPHDHKIVSVIEFGKRGQDPAADMFEAVKAAVYEFAEKVPLATAIGVLELAKLEIISEQV